MFVSVYLLEIAFSGALYFETFVSVLHAEKWLCRQKYLCDVCEDDVLLWCVRILGYSYGA